MKSLDEAANIFITNIRNYQLSWQCRCVITPSYDGKIAVENEINHSICKKVAFLKCEVSHDL